MMNANLWNPAQMMEQMMNQWMTQMNLFGQMQEQAEKATLAIFDQSRTMREQSMKMMEQFAEQAKTNARMVQETVDQNVKMTTDATASMARQGVSELSRMVAPTQN